MLYLKCYLILRHHGNTLHENTATVELITFRSMQQQHTKQHSCLLTVKTMNNYTVELNTN